MNIKQFRYGDTNLAYLVWAGTEAAAIDGGAADEILEFCRENRLELRLVLNTHDHGDHTPGNPRLLEGTGARQVTPGEAVRAGKITLAGEELLTLATPGHTMDSLVFYTGGWIVSGDTLFNGTVGNCYTKNYELYFESLNKLCAFPPESRIYAGHDLVDYAVGVARKIDPDNPHLRNYLNSYDKSDVWTCLKEELLVNPFVPRHDDRLDSYIAGLGLPMETPFEKWRAMMTVH